MDEERVNRLIDHLVAAMLQDPLELVDLTHHAVMVTLAARAHEQFCGLGAIERDRRLVEWLKDRGVPREAALRHYGWSESQASHRGWTRPKREVDPWPKLPEYHPPEKPKAPKPVREPRVHATECSVCGRTGKMRKGMCEPHYRRELARRKQQVLT